MRPKSTEKALEAVKLLERDGRKVYRVVIDGQRIELVLEKGTAPEDGADIKWSN